MPQSTFSRESNERVPAKFFGLDASPETAARLMTFHLQTNPQIQQLALRNQILSEVQKRNKGGESLFELYLNLLTDFHITNKAATAVAASRKMDYEGDNYMNDDDYDAELGGGRKKKKGTKKKKRRGSLKRSKNKIKRKKKSRKYKKKTKNKKTKKKKYKVKT